MHRRRPVVACPPVIHYTDDGEQESFVKHRLLGYGGFAAVYEVERVSDGCRMAAKVLPLSSLADANKLRRVQNEIDINQLLHHPHVVTFLGSFQDEHNVYLLQELCCITLSELLKHVGRMSELQAAHILWQVISALEHLHGCRVAHRDLKLSNMFLARDGTVKVGDLGLACHLPTSSCRRRSTCGSLNWMAPEVLRPGQHGYGLEVDIWALGVMLFSLLVGRPPFAAAAHESVTAAGVEDGVPEITCWRILHGRYRWPGTEEVALGPEARDLVARLLVVDPAARPTLEQLRSHVFFRAHLGVLLDSRPLPVPSGQRLQQQQQELPAEENGGRAWEHRLMLAAGPSAGEKSLGSRRSSLSLQSPWLLPPPAADIRLLLSEGGLEALAASAAGIGGDACDSTSGSYMEISQSEQLSVVTAASTATTATGGRCGGGADPKWQQLASADVLAGHLPATHEPECTRSHPQLPPYRMSEQTHSAKPPQALRKLFARSSVPNSPFHNPSTSISGTETGCPVSSPSVSSLTQVTNASHAAAAASGTCPSVAAAATAATAPPARFLSSALPLLPPPPSQQQQQQHHQQQPAPGLGPQPLRLPPQQQGAPLLFAWGSSKAMPGNGAGGLPLPGVDVHRGQSPLAAAAVVGAAGPGPCVHAAPVRVRCDGEWQDVETGGAAVDGAGSLPDRQTFWMRTCTGLSRHPSTVASSRSTSHRSSAFVSSQRSSAFVHAVLGPQHPHTHSQIDQQQRHQYDDQQRLLQQQQQHYQYICQQQQGSPFRSRRRRTLNSTATPVAIDPRAVGVADEDARVCGDNSSSTCGVLGPPLGMSALRTAFLSQCSSHHATVAHARRLQSSRSAHARDCMRIAAGIRSVPGGSCPEEPDNDGSSDTVRSFADSLEAMLLGGKAGAVGTSGGGGPVATGLTRRGPAPMALSGMARYGQGHAAGAGNGYTRGDFPGLATAQPAPAVPSRPVVLRHARSSIGAPSVRRCAANGGSIPIEACDGMAGSAQRHPQRRGSMPLTSWSQQLEAGPLHPATCVATLSSGLVGPEMRPERSLQMEGTSAANRSGGTVSGAAAYRSGGAAAVAAQRTRSLPAALDPLRLPVAPSRHQTHSSSAATTPQNSELLSLKVFAIQGPQSKGLPSRSFHSSQRGADSAILDGGLRLGFIDNSPHRDGAVWSGELEQLQGSKPGSGTEAARIVADLDVAPAIAGVNREGASVQGLQNREARQEEQFQLQRTPEPPQRSFLIARALGDGPPTARPGSQPMLMPDPEPWCGVARSPIGAPSSSFGATHATTAARCAVGQRQQEPQDARRCQAGGSAPVCSSAGALQLRLDPRRVARGSKHACELGGVWCTDPRSMGGGADGPGSAPPSLNPSGIPARQPCHTLQRPLGPIHPYLNFRSSPEQKQRIEQVQQEQQQQQRVRQYGDGSGFSFRMHMHPWRAMALARMCQEAMRLHRLQREEAEAAELEPEAEVADVCLRALEEAGTSSSCSAASATSLEQPLRLQGREASARATPCLQAPLASAAAVTSLATAARAAATASAAAAGEAARGVWAGVAPADVIKASEGELEVGTSAAPRSDSWQRAAAATATTAVNTVVTMEVPWTVSAGTATRGCASAASGAAARDASAAAGVQGAAPAAAAQLVLRSPPLKASPSTGWTLDRLGLFCAKIAGGCGFKGGPTSPSDDNASPYIHGRGRGRGGGSATAAHNGGEAASPKRRVASLDVERVLRHLESCDADDITVMTMQLQQNNPARVQCSTISTTVTFDGNDTPTAADCPPGHFAADSPCQASNPPASASGGPRLGTSSAAVAPSGIPRELGSSAAFGALTAELDGPDGLAVNMPSVVKADWDAAPRVAVELARQGRQKETAANAEATVAEAAGNASLHSTAAAHHILRSGVDDDEWDAQALRTGAADGKRVEASLQGFGCCRQTDAAVATAAVPASDAVAALALATQVVATAPEGPPSAASVLRPSCAAVESSIAQPAEECSTRRLVIDGEFESYPRCQIVPSPPPPQPPAATPVATAEPQLPLPQSVFAFLPYRRAHASATGMRKPSNGGLAPDAVPEMDPETLAELASRLLSKSFKDGVGSRTGSFTYRPSRMMPAAHRSPSPRAVGRGPAAGPASAAAEGAKVDGGADGRGASGPEGQAQGAEAPSGRSPAVVHPREVLMVNWLDYSSKYGLSYVLSNGAVGVLFRDGTQLLRDRGDAYAWLLGATATAGGGGSGGPAKRSGGGGGRTLTQAQPLLLAGDSAGPAGQEGRHHHDVSKKLRLLRSFEGMLLSNDGGTGGMAPDRAADGDHSTWHKEERRERFQLLDEHQQTQDSAAPDARSVVKGSTAMPATAETAVMAALATVEATAATTATAAAPPARPPPVFVTWWTRTKKALVLCMSSGTLQALFCDGSELVVREAEDEVEYLARDGRRISCSLRAARQAGPKNSVSKRIQYATMLVHSRAGHQ